MGGWVQDRVLDPPWRIQKFMLVGGAAKRGSVHPAGVQGADSPLWGEVPQQLRY